MTNGSSANMNGKPPGVSECTIRKSEESFLAGLGVPGAWWIWKTPAGNVVMVCCPKCKRLIHLSKDHVVAFDGVVTPSCKCPVPTCSFHGKVKLLDWDPGIEIAKG